MADKRKIVDDKNDGWRSPRSSKGLCPVMTRSLVVVVVLVDPTTWADDTYLPGRGEETKHILLPEPLALATVAEDDPLFMTAS